MRILKFNYKKRIEDSVYTTSYMENGKRKQIYFSSAREAQERGDSSCYELIWDNNEQCYVIGNIIK